jgi:hypothetical protein
MSDGLGFEMDISQVNSLVGNLKKAPQVMREDFRTTGQKAGLMVTGEAIKEAPVDKGFLRSKIGPPITTIGGSSLITKVTSHADYSKAVHDGTDAHVIVPSAKKALFWPGAEHPVRKVNHPGTTANPYMKRALEKTAARLTQMYSQMLVRVAQKALSA